MIDLRFVPLVRPTNTGYESAMFRSTYAQTLDLLESELAKLGASLITIQAGYLLPDIRNDGWPRSAARPSHPACVLQFTDRGGSQLIFRSHKFTRFEDNLRAIALTLQALRAVDRYGVVEGEQYTGFKQLAAAPAKMTRLDAAKWVNDKLPITDSSDRARASRLAVVLNAGAVELDVYRKILGFIVHPDRPGGTNEAFQTMQEAIGILKESR